MRPALIERNGLSYEKFVQDPLQLETMNSQGWKDSHQ